MLCDHVITLYSIRSHNNRIKYRTKTTHIQTYRYNGTTLHLHTTQHVLIHFQVLDFKEIQLPDSAPMYILLKREVHGELK